MCISHSCLCPTFGVKDVRYEQESLSCFKSEVKSAASAEGPHQSLILAQLFTRIILICLSTFFSHILSHTFVWSVKNCHSSHHQLFNKHAAVFKLAAECLV
jgi:hypothetical protein